MELITIIIIIVAWISIVLAPAAKLAYEDELNKTEEKRGTSIFPGIPFMPMLGIMCNNPSLGRMCSNPWIIWDYEGHYRISSQCPDRRRSRIVGAHLLGGAVGSEPADAWNIAAKAVDEKIYSYYSINDKVLKTLYRVGTLFCSKAIGRQPIPTNLETSAKIESIDVTREVSGHTRYHENLHTIITEI